MEEFEISHRFMSAEESESEIKHEVHLRPQNFEEYIGQKKIVDNIDAAMKRLKSIAPLNVKRLGHEAPCANTGKCENCSIQPRMCNYTTIIHHGMKFEGRISVVLIAEEVGF